MTVKDLRELAKSKGIKPLPKLKKDLIEKLSKIEILKRSPRQITSQSHKMSAEQMTMLNVLAPFYNFERGFQTSAFVTSETISLDEVKPIIEQWGPFQYYEEELTLGPYEPLNKVKKSVSSKPADPSDRSVARKLQAVAQTVEFSNVDHVVLEEAVRKDRKGQIVEWYRGTNQMRPTHEVSLMSILRLSRNIGFDDRRNVDKFEFMSHENITLKLRVHLDNFST